MKKHSHAGNFPAKTSVDDLIDLEKNVLRECFEIIYRVAASDPEPLPTNEKPWSDAVENDLKNQSGDRWPDVREFMAAARFIEVLPQDVPLEKIFSVGHAYGSPSTSFAEMAAAVDCGHVVQKTETMPHIEWLMPDDERDSVVNRKIFFSGRSHEHHRLCFDAAVWLLRSGRGLNMNLKYAGSGKADMFSMDGKMAVECGYTQSAKVLEWILGSGSGNLSAAVIPYEEETKTGVNVAYIFSSTTEGREAYMERKMQMASDMVKRMTRNVGSKSK